MCHVRCPPCAAVSSRIHSGATCFLIASAQVYYVGLGYASLFFNGASKDIWIERDDYSAEYDGTAMATPWTNFNHSVLFQAAHVPLSRFRDGANCIGVMAGNGFWNPLPLLMWGHLNLRQWLAIGQPTIALRMEIHYSDHSIQVVDTSDPALWTVGDGAIVKNNVYLGEVFDASRETQIQGWSEPQFRDAANWPSAVSNASQSPRGTLKLNTLPEFKVIEKFKPTSLQLQGSRVLIDFGINFVGVTKLTITPKLCQNIGDRIFLRYGEVLYPNGTINVMTSVAGQVKSGNGGPCAPYIAEQSDAYICGNITSGSLHWMPSFTWHGFRFAELRVESNRARVAAVSASDVTIIGLRLQNDFAQISQFECSNHLINSIHAMTLNSIRNNLINGIQTDCPHRERFGYGGDAHATAEAVLSNFDNSDLASHFFQKRLADYFIDARANGGITETAPYNGVADQGLGGGSGPIGWQVIVMKLQELARSRGGVRYRIASEARKGAQQSQFARERSLDLVEDPLVDFYEDTYRFASFTAAVAQQNGFLIPVGLGDWSSIAPRDVNYTSSVFLFEVFDTFAKIAAARGDTKNSSLFRQFAFKTQDAIIAKYYSNVTGCLAGCSQADQAFFLHYNLAKGIEMQNRVVTAMKKSVEATNYHFSTGIWGTKFLLLSLSRFNYSEHALKLLTRRDYPSFGHMLARNATSLWEVWQYSDNVYSHNHAMFGGTEDFIWKYLCGFTIGSYGDSVQFRIKPYMFSEVSHVRSSMKTPFGTLSSNWNLIHKRMAPLTILNISFTIPPNTKADVWIPLNMNNSKWRIRSGLGSGVYSEKVVLAN